MRRLPAIAATAGLALLCLLPPLQRADAQATAIPDVVARGLDSLVAGNRNAAVQVWGKSWTGEDTLQISALLSSLDRLGELLGAPIGYDLARLFDISPNLRNVYVVVRYSKQPLYAHFIAYRPARNWEVIHVTWNTEAAQVFPESLLRPER